MFSSSFLVEQNLLVAEIAFSIKNVHEVVRYDTMLWWQEFETVRLTSYLAIEAENKYLTTGAYESNTNLAPIAIVFSKQVINNLHDVGKLGCLNSIYNGYHHNDMRFFLILIISTSL